MFKFVVTVSAFFFLFLMINVQRLGGRYIIMRMRNLPNRSEKSIGNVTTIAWNLMVVAH